MKPWQAAVARPSKEMALLAKDTLKEMGYKYRRDKTYQHYTRFMIILPMPEAAHTFRFFVEEPTEFILDFFDTRPTHGGRLHFVRVQLVEDLEDVRRFMNKLVEKLPDDPWAFNRGERLRTGWLVPEYVRAKKLWRRMLDPEKYGRLKGERPPEDDKAGPTQKD